jgi:hypothetical protein
MRMGVGHVESKHPPSEPEGGAPCEPQRLKPRMSRALMARLKSCPPDRG